MVALVKYMEKCNNGLITMLNKSGFSRQAYDYMVLRAVSETGNMLTKLTSIRYQSAETQ